MGHFDVPVNPEKRRFSGISEVRRLITVDIENEFGFNASD